MRLTKEEINKYKNKEPVGYYARSAWIEFYVIEIINGIDDYMVIKDTDDKLHCLKIYYVNEDAYINYYNRHIYTSEIYKY